VIARWLAILLVNGTGIGCALGMRLSGDPIDLPALIGCSLMALAMVAASLAVLWGGIRGTWILDGCKIEYRALTGRSTAIHWADIERVLFGSGHVILRGMGAQISIPWTCMRRPVVAQAFERIHKHLSGAFDLAAEPGTPVVGECRRAFSRAFLLCATLSGGVLVSCGIMVGVMVWLSRARVELSERHLQMFSAGWIVLAMGIASTWWKLVTWHRLRHKCSRWRNRLR